MFVEALNALNVKPEETVFIDDSIQNLNAAKEVGMTPILILTKCKKGMSDFKEIERIRDILEYL